MKCFQCVHYDHVHDRCGKLEEKVVERTIYTQGGYGWDCEYCREPYFFSGNQLYGQCPYLSADSSKDRKDKENDHPMCICCNKKLDSGRFCHEALVKRVVIEYPNFRIETDAGECGIATINNTNAVAELTLDQQVVVYKLKGKGAFVELLRSRGYKINKDGSRKSDELYPKLRDILSEIGYEEYKNLVSKPKIGARFASSFGDMLEEYLIHIYRDDEIKELEYRVYKFGCLAKKLEEINAAHKKKEKEEVNNG